MNGHTEMPAISFSKDADYGTMHAVLHNWCVRVWFTDTDAILVARWEGEATMPNGDDGTGLIVWDNTAGDYINPVVVPTDNIRKVEVL